MLDRILNQKSSWEILKETAKPIFLYGTGNGADKVLDEFERLGINVQGVCASEGFVRKRDFRGFQVQSINNVIENCNDCIIAPVFASSIPEICGFIKELSQKHTLVMPVVPVFGTTLFNREYVETHIEELKNSRSLLFDEESKRIFDNMVYFQYTGDFSYLFCSESNREDDLRNILKLTDKEDMLDLGAYRGDTIEELINLTGGYSSVTAFEPDRKSFDKLRFYAEGKDNITLYPYAVYSERKELVFSGGGGRQSTLDQSGKYTVTAVDIDSLIKDKTITYLKADVEGVEKEMLMGMQNLLRTQKPKLSLACYHRTEDLCTLIPLLHQINPDYKIHLRHHPYIPFWDTNLYCI